ncbi:hypothetical protein [Enterococcus faecium]|uniref:hypothetical protein n=1 Tax=Enterococcus faecium TaxID=1352 RepID=UPI0024143021|nr:hypothetical protein [Enterococcus faecium]MDG4590300.1 hypothetical protein [Enterococcus faecium]MEB3135351.1 hypothetical protein [Enterococcus faecium]
MNQKEIVLVQFSSSAQKPQIDTKPKLVCRIKPEDKEIFIYNRMDNYLLYTLLKEWNTNAY